MKLQRILLSGLAAAALLTGCVERTLILRSDPPGATVVVNGDEAGVAPAKLHFETYGTYEVVMSAPRHHRLRALVPVRPPWYEKVPFDFFSETLWPGMHPRRASRDAQARAALGRRSRRRGPR